MKEKLTQAVVRRELVNLGLGPERLVNHDSFVQVIYYMILDEDRVIPNRNISLTEKIRLCLEINFHLIKEVNGRYIPNDKNAAIKKN